MTDQPKCFDEQRYADDIEAKATLMFIRGLDCAVEIAERHAARCWELGESYEAKAIEEVISEILLKTVKPIPGMDPNIEYYKDPEDKIGWYFYDEDESPHGPFRTYDGASIAFKEYCEDL